MLITNDDCDNGNCDLTIREDHINFEGVDSDQGAIRWGSVWLHTVENVFFSHCTARNLYEFVECRNLPNHP